MTNDSWLEIFGEASASSLEAPCSDHLPLILWSAPTIRVNRRKRFRFENCWITEPQCREIISRNWVLSEGMNLSTRFDICSRALWNLGKNLNKSLQPKIEFWKRRMEYLRGRSDNQGILEFITAQRNCIQLIEKHGTYWKQRAKVFWYKGGDNNSKFYHNSV
ncbi:PREDICTED: uncharacterized protein LOC109149908 [Ipomoea nil]|uniref:uncharacterized protein LOC109149908 n=1 Tax=Ipomoea nil TaxID=35883 RepID=UPI000900C6BF|nr:PREDICTED: uncharacterized protein LOC109149908 [Ipomoea nil]